MDSTTQLILEVKPLKMHILEMKTSQKISIVADLSRFQNVYCYPKSEEEWKKVSIDSYGLDVVWACRFEVHIDQILANATTTHGAAPFGKVI
jgi:hypothetical protein